MKKSTNFNRRKGKKARRANSVEAFVTLAEWVGMTDEEIKTSVKKIKERP